MANRVQQIVVGVGGKDQQQQAIGSKSNSSKIDRECQPQPSAATATAAAAATMTACRLASRPENSRSQCASVAPAAQGSRLASDADAPPCQDAAWGSTCASQIQDGVGDKRRPPDVPFLERTDFCDLKASVLPESLALEHRARRYYSGQSDLSLCHVQGRSPGRFAVDNLKDSAGTADSHR